MVVPTFSVIIPAHNEEHYIAHTLYSVLRQDFKDFEVIVVANGCNDKTKQVVESINSSKIKLISVYEANVSKARNKGASYASGKFLFFLDADTRLNPDVLRKVYQQFAVRHSVATVLAKPDVTGVKYSMVTGFKNFFHTAGVYRGCSGALVCRRSDFNEVGGYNPNLKVREHRDLILKLDSLGNYTCIDAGVKTSMRRYREWGLSKAAFFWVDKVFKGGFEKLYDVEYEKVR